MSLFEENRINYQAAIDLNPSFSLKGKKMLYTSSNGYMFSLLNKVGELGIRLSKEQKDLFQQENELHPFFSHGATMKDYVLIAPNLIADVKKTALWLKYGFEYVNSLTPK